jgi:predicted S18 family serine protease
MKKDAIELAKDTELIEDVLNELDRFGAKISERMLEYMESILEYNGRKILNLSSLAEEIRFEQFENEIKNNPYQLNLI